MKTTGIAAMLAAFCGVTAAIAQERTMRDCPQCPEMVRIAPGAFMMGAAPGEHAREKVTGDRAESELPQHRVTIANAFWLGKYEVARGEFAAFVDATKHQQAQTSRPADWRKPGFDQTDRHPVVNVSWNDAKAYVAWLSQTTGKQYRLPSEAEWEYAARAGTTTARYWGDGPQNACRYANVADDDSHACKDGFAATAPVGTFQPNRFGLHDMLGNVWEYTEDCWNPGYFGAPANGSPWLQGTCSRRVVRGGSWFAGGPLVVRAATRDSASRGSQSISVGFRVARSD